MLKSQIHTDISPIFISFWFRTLQESNIIFKLIIHDILNKLPVIMTLMGFSEYYKNVFEIFSVFMNEPSPKRIITIAWPTNNNINCRFWRLRADNIYHFGNISL